jgi:hypothetical protein
MIPDPAPPFEVGMSELLRQRVREWSDRAASRGFAEAFDSAIDRILDQLRTQPREWGEPSHHLRGLGMTAFRKMYERLLVIYSVHDRIPMVTIWNIYPTAGHPLAPPPPNGN